MEYLVSDIIRAAKVAIDENVSSDALTALGDLDTLTLDDIIRSKVEDAAVLVESSAAHHLLTGEQLDTVYADVIAWEDRTEFVGGCITLPDDFLRLVSFRMSDWYTTVTAPITEESPEYLMQSSRFGGVRGNPQKPVVAIVHRDGQLALEFYSCLNKNASVARALIVRRPEVFIDKNDNNVEKVNVCPKLLRAVVYRVASMTAAITGASDLAAVLLGESNALAGIVTQG